MIGVPLIAVLVLMPLKGGLAPWWSGIIAACAIFFGPPALVGLASLARKALPKGSKDKARSEFLKHHKPSRLLSE